MDTYDTSRKHFMFVIAIVAVLAVGAFSWIAIDAANIENTMMEGAMHNVVGKRQATSTVLIIRYIDSLNIETEDMNELDLVLNQI